jgi:hypothetical protein
VLWFNHPRPFSRREVAMQIVARKDEPAPDTTLIITEPKSSDTAHLRQASADAGEPLAPIRFTIAYSLREYLSILGDHVSYLVRRSRGARSRSIWMLRPWVVIIGTPLFLLKRRRMPVCAFAIDDEQIERASAAGITTRRWEDVQSVRAYSQGYLVQFNADAMPLPYRCLDGAQSARLRGMIAAHRKRTGASPGT